MTHRRRTFVVATLISATVSFGILGVHAAYGKGLTGHCGIHFGSLQKINSSGEFFNARIGPKTGTVGGPMHCYGKVLVKKRNAKGIIHDIWEPYNWLTWHWKGALALNGTASSCVGFAAAMAAEAPTGAMDTWLTASAGIGCVGGVSYIVKTYGLDNTSNASYCGKFPCNGPGKVRFSVK